MRTEIDIENPDGRLRSGMYAQVVVKLETLSGAMVVPSKALRVTEAGTAVLVAAGGSAKFKPVQVGYDDGIWAEIRAGLDEDDMVITAAGGAVAAGAQVKPVFSDS
jgi:membrane fusion protein (multidrug efflux system)